VNPYTEYDCRGTCNSGNDTWHLDLFGVCCESYEVDCVGWCGGSYRAGWETTEATTLVCCTGVDCAGYCSGTVALDSCGICSGGNSGHVADSDKNCAGVCFATTDLTCSPSRSQI
jgi:hypothetical protein